MSDICCDNKTLCAAALVKAHELFKKAVISKQVIGKELLDCFEKRICEAVRIYDYYLEAEDKAMDLNKCGTELVNGACDVNTTSCLNCDDILKEYDEQEAALEDAKKQVCELLKELVKATDNLKAIDNLTDQIEDKYIECIHKIEHNNDCGC